MTGVQTCALRSKVLLDAIAGKYDELACTKDVKARAIIQQSINDLSVRAGPFYLPAAAETLKSVVQQRCFDFILASFIACSSAPASISA